MDEAIVVGGGVIGLTTAVVLAERGMDVRVWSRGPVEETASAVSGGLCWPYRIEPQAKAVDWAERSFRHFAWLSEQAHTGVRLVRGRKPGDDETPQRWLKLVGTPPRTPIVDMQTYLAYLHGRLTAAGGAREERELTCLEEAAGQAPVVVNCSGLGARELVPDAAMRPVRGQIVVVENPGIEEWYLASDPDTGAVTYVLPQPYGLLLGGTSDEDAWDTRADPATAESIVRRCARVHPELADARVLEHRVGLRPYRPAVRLEAERLAGGSLCVHNYGHGGAGVTVSWGCALDAAHLVADGAESTGNAESAESTGSAGS
jgi:D-amino-acid oxidase